MKHHELIKDYAWISVSACLTAIAVNFFFTSTGIAPGGITGMAIVFSTILHIPIEYMTLGISIPLLLVATLLLGKSFGIKTLYITFATPIFMHLVPNIPLMEYLPQALAYIIAAVAGGLLVGSAIGIALNHACATGGTDVIALLIQYVCKRLDLSKILLFLDGSVVIASGIISQNIMIAFLSLISLLIIIKTISYFTTKKLTANIKDVTILAQA